MDFILSDYSGAVVQQIGEPETEKIMLDGEQITAYVFKDKKLMSPGIWNKWYYSPEEIQKLFNNTDWSDANITSLYADHADKTVVTYLGQIRNPRMIGNDQIGDLVIVNKDQVTNLMFGAKFGISPKITGDGQAGAVLNGAYENFSLVTNPACKTTFLNSEQEKNKDNQALTSAKSKSGETKSEEEMVKIDETKEKVEEKLSGKTETSETKGEPVEDVSTELVAKLSELMSEGFAKVEKRLSDMEETKSEPEPVKVEPDKPEETKDEDLAETEDDTTKVSNTLSKPTPAPAVKVIRKPIRQSLKDSDLEYDDVALSSGADSGMAKYLTSLDNGRGEKFELSMEEEKSNVPWMTFTLASLPTTVSDTRGSSRTAYNLLPTTWAKSVIDGGKNQLYFLNAVKQSTVPTGTNSIIMPLRKAYEDTWESSSEEYGVSTDISATVLSDVDGVEFAPTRYNYRVALTNKMLNTNAINMVRYAREELAYKWANDIDGAIATGLVAATVASSGVPGRMDLFGGDASSTTTLTDGDTIDTDMIAEAETLLEDKYNWYWDGVTHTRDSTLKNPWVNTSDSPYLLFIAPKQREIFRKDSQFVNASEYGSDDVLLNGEIGNYLGVKVITSNNVPSYTNFGAGGDVTGHKCIMVKSQYCGGIGWGQKPQIKAFDWPMRDQKQVILNFEYDVEALQKDAIVLLNVTDK